MAAQWIRVRDTRTGEILPNPVPIAWLGLYDYLKEVPSSRSKRRVVIPLEEPVQPAQAVPDEVITEPVAQTPKAKSGQKTITGK